MCTVKKNLWIILVNEAFDMYKKRVNRKCFFQKTCISRNVPTYFDNLHRLITQYL